MNRNPFKLFPDSWEAISLLTDDEAGQLLKAIMAHINGEEAEASGQVKLAFLLLKQSYDRENDGEYKQQQSDNGKKGGRKKKAPGFSENPPVSEKTPRFQEKAPGFSENPPVSSEKRPSHDYDYDYDHDYEYEIDHDHDSGGGTGLDNGTASPTAAADPLITYAVNNLGIMSPRAMEELNSFRDELPDDVIRAGIDAALDANVRTWAYARSILNRYADAGYKTVGEIKAAESKRKAAKANGVSDGNGGKVQNPALNYAQRDYASPASDADIVYMTFDDDDEGG